MISIKVDMSGMKALDAKLNGMGKQVNYAAAVALTKTAKKAQEKAAKEIAAKLDRPTRYALGMLNIKPATKNKLEAMVYAKDSGTLQKSGMKSQADVLGHLFSGGKRIAKNSEIMLIRAGLMRPGEIAVPGKSVALDSYGNFPRALLIQILAYFSAFGEQGYKANMTAATRGKFDKRMGKKVAGATVQYIASDGTGKTKHLSRGIWKRVTFGHGSALKPVLMFVSGGTYRRYFDLSAAAKEAIDENFRREFDAALDEAIRTAR